MDRDSSSAEHQKGARGAEERRVVTTLFCDLVGFTTISERNDPEIVDVFLRRYYATARRVVESYGGTVEKYIGDAVVAVFGVPILHEDDPERAVRAGLRLVDEIDALPGVGGQAVEVRVGVNTGEALVRLDVDSASGEGFLTGDAVNVAARLQSAAPPMAVAVGEATHAATENVFAFDACHPVALRGKSQALQVWIATAPLARTGSELRSFATSFVGREAELGALEELLHRVTEANHAELALIVGEPGIGKSRLLAEFARRLDDGSTLVTWRQGRCLPFGSNVTFWALSEIVRACAGVLESDGVARTEARLETVLPQTPDRDSVRARLRPLLGLEAEEASREENFAAWREFLEAQAAGPTLIVVEDLHWADEPMLAFLDDFAQNLGDVPLLLLATARQEVLEFTDAGAGFVSAAEHIALAPLSGDETAQLILARLGARSLPVSLQAALLERSGGNPLFAEELVRLLEDRDLLENRGGTVALRPGVELPMPDSIGALIAARLDLLAPDRKALLGDASVVGRSFWAGAVAAVSGREPAEVLLGLHELVAKELVRPVRGSSVEGETEFLFVHALVCDVAYAQLTRADRAVKHAALARWLEERSRGSTEDMAEILAYHYGTALEMATSCGLDLEDELLEPTSRYLALAGGRAAPLDATAAAAHLARARRVDAEAARPRRWLLSRRTRRAIRRRSPLLVGVTAVALVALVGALVAWASISPEGSGPAATAAQTPTTAAEMATAYGPGVARITGKAPMVEDGRFTWKEIVGSGFLIDDKGVILTSSAVFTNLWGPQLWKGDHYRIVIAAFQARDVTVEFWGNKGEYTKLPGFVFGFDPMWGASYISVDPEKVKATPLPLGDSQTLREGASLVALSRQAMMIARTEGEVSRLWRVKDASGMKVVRTIHIDASFPQGTDNRSEALPFIGGPLLDASGRVVAMVGPDFQPQTRHGQQDVGSAQAIRGLIANLALYNQGLQGFRTWMGSLTATYYPPGQAKRLGVPVKRGILVEYVIPGGAAARAGIRGGNQVGSFIESYDGATITNQCVIGGDVIVAIDGRPVSGVGFDAWSQYAEACNKNPGDSVRFTLLRGQRRFTVVVPLDDYPYVPPAA